VAYHHLIGFGPIRVYDHDSTDDTGPRLEHLSRSGLAEHTPWSVPPDMKPQWLAYEDGLERLRRRADWIAFIDLDEFIVLPRHETVQEFLAEHGRTGAIAINWKMFGSSGHLRHDPGLVIERFRRCARRSFKGNRAVKTLARVDAIDVPRVHTCQFRSGVEYATVDGQVLGPTEGRSASATHDVVRINHYFTRSREEWAEKSARGRGAKTADHPKKHRTIAEFEANDRNEKEEHEITAFAQPVRELLTSIGVVVP
jgi:hypothetical protein